jgi:hypothetical protein
MIKQGLKAFSLILKNPKLLNRILEDNSVWEQYVAKNYPAFKMGLPVVEINDLLPGFKETLETVVYLGGGSTVPDLCILKATCKSIPNCSYFELGTWMGESVKNVSEVCSECVTLNLDPTVYANGKYKEVMGLFSKNLKNVKQLYGDSTTFNFAGLNKKFDVVFIDADHHYSAIKSDSSKVLNNIVHEKSTIIWHDYCIDPASPRFQTLAAILDGLPSNLHKNLYQVSNSLCAIYTTRSLPSKELQSPAIPNKKFKVSIETIPL